MKGIVVERTGGPEVLQIRTVPTPELRPGWILINVKAFGLNRSEIFRPGRIIKNFEPLLVIPSTVKLTVYKSEIISAVNSTKALEQIVDGVANGRYHVNLDKVLHFDEIVKAHHYMEENRSKGKLVVVVDQ